MKDLKLPSEVATKVRAIAKSYGFSEVSLDTQFPFEGFRRTFACTRNPEKITYRYLFLEPVVQFYAIDQVLLEKATESLTLHERMHHLAPFNSDPNVDDYLVQQQACASSGNQLEMMFLDVLTAEFARVPFLEESVVRDEVIEHAGRYFWIKPEERAIAARDA